MAQVQSQKGRGKTGRKVVWEFPLERKNWIILGIGAATIIVGFLLMATANTDDPVKHQEVWNSALAISIAPILLVAGFVGIIPYGLFWRDKSSDANS